MISSERVIGVEIDDRSSSIHNPIFPPCGSSNSVDVLFHFQIISNFERIFENWIGYYHRFSLYDWRQHFLRCENLNLNLIGWNCMNTISRVNVKHLYKIMLTHSPPGTNKFYLEHDTCINWSWLWQTLFDILHQVEKLHLPLRLDGRPAHEIAFTGESEITCFNESESEIAGNCESES